MTFGSVGNVWEVHWSINDVLSHTFKARFSTIPNNLPTFQSPIPTDRGTMRLSLTTWRLSIREGGNLTDLITSSHPSGRTLIFTKSGLAPLSGRPPTVIMVLEWITTDTQARYIGLQKNNITSCKPFSYCIIIFWSPFGGAKRLFSRYHYCLLRSVDIHYHDCDSTLKQIGWGWWASSRRIHVTSWGRQSEGAKVALHSSLASTISLAALLRARLQRFSTAAYCAVVQNSTYSRHWTTFVCSASSFSCLLMFIHYISSADTVVGVSKCTVYWIRA